ncbi:MAG: nucleoside 2-deoxyribosyltransferase [Actinomycetota bacterium]|nr:nucleoside 2-deoxyribosyltransferase [Actinomycetota bacterium]
MADDLPVPVYVAGPDGFTPAGLQWHRQILLPALEAAGLDPLSPWGAHSAVTALAAGAGAGALGPGAPDSGAPDPGTPDVEFAEIEAMPAGPERLMRYQDVDHRTGAANAALIDRSRGMLAVLDGPDVDSGTAAEIGYAARGGIPVVGLRTDSRRTGDNEGVTVNLQVEFFIHLSGGSVHRQLHPAIVELASLLRPATG